MTSPSGGCPSSVCVFRTCGTFLYGTEAFPFLSFIGFYKSHFIFTPANLPGLDCMWRGMELHSCIFSIQIPGPIYSMFS